MRALSWIVNSEVKAKRRKSVGSTSFTLKFRPDERRVHVRQKGRELVTNKRKPALEEAEEPMTEPRHL